MGIMTEESGFTAAYFIEADLKCFLQIVNGSEEIPEDIEGMPVEEAFDMIATIYMHTFSAHVRPALAPGRGQGWRGAGRLRAADERKQHHGETPGQETHPAAGQGRQDEQDALP